MQAKEWGNFGLVLNTAAENAENDWEKNFTSDMTDKYANYSGSMFVSEKQAKMLEKISGLTLEKAPPPEEKPMDDIPF